MIKKCIICNKKIKITLYRINRGEGKFCSRKCKNKFQKGKPPWNKGTKGICKVTKTSFKKGQHPSPKTEFKKGHKTWNKNKKGIHLSPKSEFKKGCISLRKGKKFPEFSKKNHPNWKGGKYIHDRGYIYILKPEHPFANKQGYIFEHRLVMEKHIGQYLKPRERVHHKGIKYPLNSIKNRQDNRIKNLKLFKNNSQHRKFHILQNIVKKKFNPV